MHRCEPFLITPAIFFRRITNINTLTDFIECRKNLGNKTTPNKTPNVNKQMLSIINVFGFRTYVVTIDILRANFEFAALVNIEYNVSYCPAE